jgi:hypothetical protein
MMKLAGDTMLDTQSVRTAAFRYAAALAPLRERSRVSSALALSRGKLFPAGLRRHTGVARDTLRFINARAMCEKRRLRSDVANAPFAVSSRHIIRSDGRTRFSRRHHVSLPRPHWHHAA